MVNTEYYGEDDDKCPDCGQLGDWCACSAQCPDCGYEMSNCICIQFADPGGNSALRAATPRNPRNLPCPTCGEPNKLTPADRAQGYQCDSCADQAERRGW